MKVTLTPHCERAEKVFEKYGTEFDVLAVEKDTILVRTRDEEWQGVFNKTEASWPENLLGG